MKECMKILIINWRDIKNPEAGGAEVHLHEIFKRIVKKGHEVFLISSKFDNCVESEIIDGISVFRVGRKHNFNFIVPFYYLTKLRKEKFDIIIDDISKIPLCTPLYIKKPMIGIIHHVHGNTLFKELPFIAAGYIWLSERLLIPLYKQKKMICVSNSTKEELIGMGIPDKNITVIYNGYDRNGSLPAVTNRKSKIPTITYVGRVKAYKQLDHLIRAFKIVRNNIKDCKLIIAGKGEKEYLKNIALKLSLDSSVEFHDEVSEEEKFRLLHEAWIFATPSMKEGWGITVVEANACGTLAIGYDVPGLRDSIIDGYNGLLVEKGDITSLGNSIIELIKNEELRNKLNSNAIEWSGNFSWDKSAKEFEEYFVNNGLNKKKI